MKGDLSRDTFRRKAHYSAVRMQQGRVVTDADFNEQADITRHRDERLARDTVGPCGAPMDCAGFALTAETNALAVLAVNANVAWILAEDGVLLRTGNGGADWTLADLATTAQLRAAGRAGNVGWAVGDGGTVRKTSNLGTSWIAQDAGTLAALRGVAVFDATHAWAVGDGGIAIATSDGGANWSQAKTGASRLYAVSFIDEFAGLAVGQGGAIVATDDGGETWTLVDSGSTSHLRALAASGTTLAWAAGDGGTILRTEDGGATWLAGNTPSDANLHAIVFRDAEEGWAVGDAGTVLHSVDGGANWTLEDPGTEATLHGLSIASGNAPWAVGDASTVLRLGGGSPDVVEVDLPAVNLSIGPGRYYVDGVMCELAERASFAHQPDGGAPQRLAPGAYIVYIDAWQRHVSSLEDPYIREVALGGPDTATRAQTVAQVRALALPSSSPFDWNCDSSVAGWDELVHAERPRMAARAEPQLASTNLCDIAATAGYRRLENQLYRVEVHTGGANPTFKWSRENGSVAYAVLGVSVDTAQQQTVVRVAARGRDANLDVAVHDRVELVDDDAELTNRCGVLFEYLSDGDDELELVLKGVPGGSLGQDADKHPVLRRWDHRPATVGANALPIVEGTWIDLEEGVQVRFETGGAYRPGDYWQIPARTITADVEWPRTPDGDPQARHPSGIKDGYCRLGIVEVDAQGVLTVASDCRELFPPLTALESLLYVSGDGQDAAPGAPLRQRLIVRVARGTVPARNMRVRFEIETGGGRIGSGTGGSPYEFETRTDDEGVAWCRWTLGPGASAPSRFQRVRARLLNADGMALPGQMVVFCATASYALQYVSGDGQQVAPGQPLPHPIEVRVGNGVDGVAGVPLQVTLEQGGGSIGSATATTGPQGIATIPWTLGTAGPQRLSVELTDASGTPLQRMSFNATATAPGGAGSKGCDITIGPGGDFDRLTSDLLTKLLQEAKGNLCVCFMPGTHTIETLEISGSKRFRLSLHGCGHASIVRAAGPLTFAAFAALEVRDLVLQMEAESTLVLKENVEVQLTSLQIIRARAQNNLPCVQVAGAQSVDVIDCDMRTTMPSAAAIFEGITGGCRVLHSRFVGVVSFYGAPGDVPTSDILRRLLEISRDCKLEPGAQELKFCNNTVSMLAISAVMLKSLIEQRTATGLFETATLTGNTVTESLNLFVASRMGVVSNDTWTAEPGAQQSLPYGLFIAERGIASGNITMLQTRKDCPLIFGMRAFDKAANVAMIEP